MAVLTGTERSPRFGPDSVNGNGRPIDRHRYHRRWWRSSNLVVAAAATLLLISGLFGTGSLFAAPWIVITEIHYHPPEGDVLEFVEIYNRQPPRADLSEWTLEGEVSFDFPIGTSLGAGEHLVLARDPEALRSRTPEVRRVMGPFSGRLNNAGGNLRLRNSSGALVCEVAYGANGRWPSTPNGSGHTLSILDPGFEVGAAESWAPSARPGGTPGTKNRLKPRRRRPRLVINEVFLPPPGIDAEPFVELFNPGLRKVALKGYSLTDDPKRPRRIELSANADVEPLGFHTLSGEAIAALVERQSRGDALILFARGGERAEDLWRLKRASKAGKRRKKRKKEEGDEGAPRPSDAGIVKRAVSRGRVPDGARDVARLTAPSPGAANALAPTVGSVVINEIMYHPMSDEVANEYVELYNHGDEALDLSGYSFSEGIAFKFKKSDGVRLAAGDYLVIAKDPAALRKKYRLDEDVVVGPFKGRLADRGEPLTLLDKRGAVVDRVTYGDRAPWPHWADGLGASLELRNPALDNSLAGAWVASDHSADAEWKQLRYAKPHRAFKGRSMGELQFMLLNEGECLIDDVRLQVSRRRFLAVDSFERGDKDWQAMGTHAGSGIWRGKDRRGRASYHLVAEGRGDPRHNYLTLPLPQPLEPGRSYGISFRAKWLRGTPLLLSRTAGQGVAQTHRLEVPERLGTPGASNSGFVKNPAPVVGVPAQFPVAPSSKQRVRFTVAITALDPVENAAIHYRRDNAKKWRTARLEPQPGGHGLWTASLPRLGDGVFEFFVQARGSGGVGTYPVGAPERTALFAVGIELHEEFPTYTLLVREQDWEELVRRPSYAENRLSRGTFVYRDAKIFYDVRFRFRGSPHSRRARRLNSWRIRFGDDTLDGRRKLNVDGQGADGRRPHEALSLWLLESLRTPNPRLQYVYFNIFGRREGVHQDVERIDGDFVNRWFDRPREKGAGDAEGSSAERHRPAFHKVDNHFEFFSVAQRENTHARLEYVSPDPEVYRWHFPPRGSHSADDDFEPLIELIKLMDPEHTSDRVFLKRVEELVDVDEWLRVLAVRAMVTDQDAFGRRRGKNAFIYKSPHDGRWHMLPFDCDYSASWSPSRTGYTLFHDRFRSFVRLMGVPKYRQRFFSYLSFLAQRKFTSKELGRTLKEIGDHAGVEMSPFESFAKGRRKFVSDAVPRARFRIRSVKRVRRSDLPDLLRVRGTAPLFAHRAQLDGREGVVRFARKAWSVEIPIGPEGGQMALRLLDYGGREIVSEQISVRARPEALPLEGSSEKPEAAHGRTRG